MRDLMALSRRVEKLKDEGVEEERIPAVAIEGLRALSALVTPEDARWFLDLEEPRKEGRAAHDWGAFERLTERYPEFKDRWGAPFELLRVYRHEKAKVAEEDRRARAKLAELDRRDRDG